MDAELLTDMAIFAAVVEQNSFSAAAETLQISKSNVSRRVASLEKRLEMRLMHRTTRKLGLTESGRIYYEYCARLVNEAQSADDAIRAMHSEPSGLLNISLPETLGRAFILPLLPEFLKMYPDIRLNLSITSRKVNIGEERCDVAVRKGAIEDDTLCAIPLGSSVQYFYVSPKYLPDPLSLKRPEDLCDHAFLSSKIDFAPIDLLLSRRNETTSVRVNPRISVQDHEAVLLLTLAGLGVSLLPGWMVRKHLRNGQLVQVLPEYRGPSVDFSVVFQPHRGMAPNLRAFVEFLKQRFKVERPWELEFPGEFCQRKSA